MIEGGSNRDRTVRSAASEDDVPARNPRAIARCRGHDQSCSCGLGVTDRKDDRAECGVLVNRLVSHGADRGEIVARIERHRGAARPVAEAAVAHGQVVRRSDVAPIMHELQQPSVDLSLCKAHDRHTWCCDQFELSTRHTGGSVSQLSWSIVGIGRVDICVRQNDRVSFADRERVGRDCRPVVHSRERADCHHARPIGQAAIAHREVITRCRLAAIVDELDRTRIDLGLCERGDRHSRNRDQFKLSIAHTGRRIGQLGGSVIGVTGRDVCRTESDCPAFTD